MWPNPPYPVDLVTFTEEILDVKLFCVQYWWFLCTPTSFDCSWTLLCFWLHRSERRFLYIFKAFERAWLKGLIHKTKYIDVDGSFSKLVESVLNVRNHLVVLNVQASSWPDVTQYTSKQSENISLYPISAFFLSFGST